MYARPTKYNLDQALTYSTDHPHIKVFLLAKFDGIQKYESRKS
jgi:hypothetical protein